MRLEKGTGAGRRRNGRKKRKRGNVEGGQEWKGDRVKRKAKGRKGKQAGREKIIKREDGVLIVQGSRKKGQKEEGSSRRGRKA
jgi:hypothetical protein